MADAILVLNAGSSSIKFSAFDAAQRRARADAARPDRRPLHGSRDSSAKDAQGASIGSKAWDEGTRARARRGDRPTWSISCGAARGGDKLVAVGHRVVHGGMEFTQAVRVTPEVIAALGKLSPLAPLHQPHNLKPIEIVAKLRPELPQVACFDTAFHRAQPEVAQAFALPPSITDAGVRRYGFHGLSYEYIAGVLPQFDAEGRARAAPWSRTWATAAACARW